MRKVMIGLFSALLFAACSTDSGNLIEGKITGGEGQTIFLQRFEKNQVLKLDSAVIDANGKFSMNPSQALEKNFYRLMIDQERSMVFIADSLSSVYIEATYDDFDKNRSAKGNNDNELLFGFYAKVRPLVEREEELRKVTRSESNASEERSQALQQLVDLMKEKRTVCKEFVDANANSPAALAALEELNIAQDADAYTKVLEGLKGVFDHTIYYQMVVDQVAMNDRQQKLKANPAAQPQKNALFTEGMEAPEIAMADTKGTNRKLSDLRGKVVLIDFWASWCGPCRRENPNVVRVYEKYKDKGFDIFSVSLDSDGKKWAQAIKQDGLVWDHHVSDLKGWQNAAAKQYGVSSIPHTILLGKDGKIVKTHLRGNQLETALAELLGS